MSNKQARASANRQQEYPLSDEIVAGLEALVGQGLQTSPPFKASLDRIAQRLKLSSYRIRLSATISGGDPPTGGNPS